MSDIESYDWIGALHALTDGGVHFVLIGGVAARVLGSPIITRDLDICYARDRENLKSLATVLQSVNARLRGVSEDVPFRLDVRTLAAGDSFTFVTDLGDLDILATPSGTFGFDDLVRAATPMDIGGRSVLVASVDDLIRMKLAAGRLKDLAAVDILGALREELAEHG